jgi:hypothetical protein
MLQKVHSHPVPTGFCSLNTPQDRRTFLQFSSTALAALAVGSIGCATRALVKIDGVADVCSVYSGPHPILYCGDFAGHLKTFAQLYGLEIRTNC